MGETMEQNCPDQTTEGTLNSPKYSNGTETTDSLPRQSRMSKKTTFNEEQLTRLEALYRQDKYPSGEKRCEIADELGVSDYKIKVWFQNRRMKEKRERMTALHSLALISRQLYTDNLAQIEERTSPVHTAVQSLANLSTPAPTYSPKASPHSVMSCCVPAYSPDILRQDNNSQFSPYLRVGPLMASPFHLRYDSFSSARPHQGGRIVFSSPLELSRRNQYAFDSNTGEHMHGDWRSSETLAPKNLLPTFHQGLPYAVPLPEWPSTISTGSRVPFRLQSTDNIV